MHLRGLKDFIYMLRERNNQEVDNALNLKKIHGLNYAVTTFPSLLEGIICFKGDMLNQSNYLSEFCTNINDEIINPLVSLHEKISNKISYLNYEMKTAEKNYNNMINQLEETKNNFHSSALEAEIFKIKNEVEKKNNTLSHDTIIDNEKKIQNYLKKAKLNENIYLRSVSQANFIQGIYIETKKKILNEFQRLEEELSENIKDSLRKYVIYQVAYLRNMQYDIDKKAKAMEEINTKQDIKHFIFNNATNDLPPYKFEFIPFNADLTQNKSINSKYPKEILENVKSFFSNAFYSESPEDIQETDIKTQNEIESIINNCIQGKILPKDFQKIISNYLKETHKMKLVLQGMNQIRQKGMFTLNEQSYKNIGNILLECLNIIQMNKENYYPNAKMLMNLATSLYKPASESNKPRIFLQDYLQGHTIWNQNAFWTGMIKYYIVEEMHNQKNYNIYNIESYEQKEERIKALVKTQLNSSLYNMISFDTAPNVIKNCLIELVENYEIEQEFVNKFNETLKDYEKKRNEREK
ncbi:MAG: hypothetical protein MJ252_07695, partial [archaeon]|nr:hypothetical protein [archaeon]